MVPRLWSSRQACVLCNPEAQPRAALPQEPLRGPALPCPWTPDLWERCFLPLRPGTGCQQCHVCGLRSKASQESLGCPGTPDAPSLAWLGSHFLGSAKSYLLWAPAARCPFPPNSFCYNLRLRTCEVLSGTRTMHVPVLAPKVLLTRGQPWWSRGGPHGCLSTGRRRELSTTYTRCQQLPLAPCTSKTWPPPAPGLMAARASHLPRNPLHSPNTPSSNQPSGKPHSQALMAPTTPISRCGQHLYAEASACVEGGRTQVCVGLPCKTHPQVLRSWHL